MLAERNPSCLKTMRRRETKDPKLSTAHTVWDRRWTTAAGRADWTEPESEVRAVRI